jgi:hypothetical protein
MIYHFRRGRKRLQLMARGKEKRKKLLAEATDPTQITHTQQTDDLPFSPWEEEAAADGQRERKKKKERSFLWKLAARERKKKSR